MRPKKQHSDAPHAPRFVTQILNSGLDPQMCARASVNSAQACCLVHNEWRKFSCLLIIRKFRIIFDMPFLQVTGNYGRGAYVARILLRSLLHKLLHIFFTDCIRLH